MQHDELIEQLRHPYSEIAGMVADEAADRIEALIAAGDKLAGFATCDNDVCFSGHGKPCNCGYEAAEQAWRAVRDA